MPSGKISKIGEFGLIRRLTRDLRKKSDILIGVGDDCAVVRPGIQSRARQAVPLLLTTDMLIEGHHFRSDWMMTDFTFRKEGISMKELQSGGRRRPVSVVRSCLALEMVRDYGYSLAETARQLGVTTSGIAKLLLRNK